MNKQEVFEKFVTESAITIPRFTGDDDGGLGFLDQPDSWGNASIDEVVSAKQRVLQIASHIPARAVAGKKLASLVAHIAGENGDSDAEHIAAIIAGDPEYVRADLLSQEVNNGS